MCPWPLTQIKILQTTLYHQNHSKRKTNCTKNVFQMLKALAQRCNTTIITNFTILVTTFSSQKGRQLITIKICLYPSAKELICGPLKYWLKNTTVLIFQRHYTGSIWQSQGKSISGCHVEFLKILKNMVLYKSKLSNKM